MTKTIENQILSKSIASPKIIEQNRLLNPRKKYFIGGRYLNS